MDLSWASLPPASDPALAEWLVGASCSPRVKALAVRAADAAGRGVSADRLRRDLLAEHPDASALVTEAEECTAVRVVALAKAGKCGSCSRDQRPPGAAVHDPAVGPARRADHDYPAAHLSGRPRPGHRRVG